MTNKSSNRFNDKNIPLRDFIYLLIIMVVITVCMVSMTLSDSTRAGENLNFAATLSSIILAVLAIIITLVESVTQKENLKKLAELSEVMDRTIEKSQSLVNDTFEKSKEQVLTITNLKDELKDHYEKSVISLKENLSPYAEGSKTLDKESLDKILKESLTEINNKITLNKSINNPSDIDLFSEYVYKKFDFSKHRIPEDEVKKYVNEMLVSIGISNPIKNRVPV